MKKRFFAFILIFALSVVALSPVVYGTVSASADSVSYNQLYRVDFNQLIQNGNFENGITGFGSRWFMSSKTVSSGVCSINGSISGADIYNVPNISLSTANCPDFVIGHKYLTLAECRSVNLVISVGLAFGEDLFRDYQPINDSDFTQCYWFTDCTKTNKIFGLLVNKSSQSTTIQASFQLKNLQLFDLTQMFGIGFEPLTVEEFRDMYSADYYGYTLSDWQVSVNLYETAYLGYTTLNSDAFLLPDDLISAYKDNSDILISVFYDNGSFTVLGIILLSLLGFCLFFAVFYIVKKIINRGY